LGGHFGGIITFFPILYPRIGGGREFRTFLKNPGKPFGNFLLGQENFGLVS